MIFALVSLMMDRFLDSNKPESADKEPQPVAWLWQNERVERTKTAKKMFFKTASVPNNTLLTSYKVVYTIAKCKKPNTIADQLILRAAW